MISLTSNLSAADAVAHQLIRERVQDAERRTQVRAARVARRTARRQARSTVPVPPAGRELPWWALRYTHPAR